MNAVATGLLAPVHRLVGSFHDGFRGVIRLGQGGPDRDRDPTVDFPLKVIDIEEEQGRRADSPSPRKIKSIFSSARQVSGDTVGCAPPRERRHIS